MGTVTLCDLPSWPGALDRDLDELVDAGAGMKVRRWLGVESTPHPQDDEEMPFTIQAWAYYDDRSRRYDIVTAWVEKPLGGPLDSSHHLRLGALATLFRQLARDVVVEWPEPFTGYPDAVLPRSRNMDDNAYLKIGIVHRIHDMLGNRQMSALTHHFEVSRPTAAKWLKEIDARGLMEPIDT